MENVPYEGGPKPLFGRGVIREVFLPPLFSTPPCRPLKEPISITCERFARIASNLRFPIFSPLEARFAKEGLSSGTLKRFARIRRFARICESRESGHLRQIDLQTHQNALWKQNKTSLFLKTRRGVSIKGGGFRNLLRKKMGS